jgi:DNA-binding protein HU-beta
LTEPNEEGVQGRYKNPETRMVVRNLTLYMPVGINTATACDGSNSTETDAVIWRMASFWAARWIDKNFLNQSARVIHMNKGELIDAVAGSAGLSRADATKAVDAVLDSIQGTLASGGSVSLVGFGTFSVKARAARAGRNPRTGETIQIPASNVPGFKAGKGLKDAVN